MAVINAALRANRRALLRRLRNMFCVPVMARAARQENRHTSATHA